MELDAAAVTPNPTGAVANRPMIAAAKNTLHPSYTALAPATYQIKGGEPACYGGSVLRGREVH